MTAQASIIETETAFRRVFSLGALGGLSGITSSGLSPADFLRKRFADGLSSENLSQLQSNKFLQASHLLHRRTKEQSKFVHVSPSQLLESEAAAPAAKKVEAIDGNTRSIDLKTVKRQFEEISKSLFSGTFSKATGERGGEQRAKAEISKMDSAARLTKVAKYITEQKKTRIAAEFLLAYFSEFRFFKQISQQIKEDLLRQIVFELRLSRCEKHETIFAYNDVGGHMYFVLQGKVAILIPPAQVQVHGAFPGDSSSEGQMKGGIVQPIKFFEDTAAVAMLRQHSPKRQGQDVSAQLTPRIQRKSGALSAQGNGEGRRRSSRTPKGISKRVHGSFSKETTIALSEADGQEGEVSATTATKMNEEEEQFEEFKKCRFPLFKRVNVISEGNSFGEVALEQRIPRTASAVTMTSCCLATLSYESYRKLLGKIYAGIQMEQRNILRKIPSLKDFPNQGIMIIYNNTEAISLANNTCIYKEGDKANFVYIITEGEVEISKNFKPEKSTTPSLFVKQRHSHRLALSSLLYGSMFGEYEGIETFMKTSQQKKQSLQLREASSSAYPTRVTQATSKTSVRLLRIDIRQFFLNFLSFSTDSDFDYFESTHTSMSEKILSVKSSIQSIKSSNLDDSQTTQLCDLLHANVSSIKSLVHFEKTSFFSPLGSLKPSSATTASSASHSANLTATRDSAAVVDDDCDSIIPKNIPSQKYPVDLSQKTFASVRSLEETFRQDLLQDFIFRKRNPLVDHQTQPLELLEEIYSTATSSKSYSTTKGLKQHLSPPPPSSRSQESRLSLSRVQQQQQESPDQKKQNNHLRSQSQVDFLKLISNPSSKQTSVTNIVSGQSLERNSSQLSLPSKTRVAQTQERLGGSNRQSSGDLFKSLKLLKQLETETDFINKLEDLYEEQQGAKEPLQVNEIQSETPQPPLHHTTKIGLLLSQQRRTSSSLRRRNSPVATGIPLINKDGVALDNQAATKSNENRATQEIITIPTFSSQQTIGKIVSQLSQKDRFVHPSTVWQSLLRIPTHAAVTAVTEADNSNISQMFSFKKVQQQPASFSRHNTPQKVINCFSIEPIKMRMPQIIVDTPLLPQPYKEQMRKSDSTGHITRTENIRSSASTQDFYGYKSNMVDTTAATKPEQSRSIHTSSGGLHAKRSSSQQHITVSRPSTSASNTFSQRASSMANLQSAAAAVNSGYTSSTNSSFHSSPQQNTSPLIESQQMSAPTSKNSMDKQRKKKKNIFITTLEEAARLPPTTRKLYPQDGGMQNHKKPGQTTRHSIKNTLY